MSRGALAFGLAALLASLPAGAEERGEANASLRVFGQPASSAWLLVVTPAVNGNVSATPWLHFDVNWLADVVTGATPRTYGSPDVVSAATRFTEVRNVIGAGATVDAGPVSFAAGYAYGTESDFHSHLLRASVKADLFQHDTVISAEYGHSWNRVCDLAQADLPVLLRRPLDSSRGCFRNTPTLTEEALDTDSLDLAWVQTLTPRLVGALVGTYQRLDGFQSSPYRAVRLDGGQYQAQESHPRLRDRVGFTARSRLAVPSVQATFGFDLRLYRDTWAVQSITGEATWEQPFRQKEPAWRFQVRARGYAQSGAVFYKDAGNANSYENTGPAGSYFTADPEMAPLADLLLGFRAYYKTSPPTGKRFGRMFTSGEWGLFFNYLKQFALSPDPPVAARMSGFASALVLGGAVDGQF